MKKVADGPRYFDITDAGTAPDALCEATLRDLRARGFAPLCAIRGVYEGGRKIEWTVLTDADCVVAVSVCAVNGTVSLYAVTRDQNEEILETQWSPSLGTWLEIGPSGLLSDRMAKRINNLVFRRSVSAAMEAHARVQKKRLGETIPWTPESYLAFRAATGWLSTIDAWSRVYLSAKSQDLSILLVGAIALARHVPVGITLLVLVAYMLCLYLFLGRLWMWAWGFAVKRFPLGLRERIMRRARAAAKVT